MNVMHRHRLIIRHPTRAGVIGTDTSDALSLPRVDTGDSHTADVGELNAAIESRYSIRVTVLRSLAHGEVCDGVVERSHEIEVHGGLERCSLDWRCAETLTLDAADSAAVAAWRVPVSRIDGRDWTLPGWFDTASAWIGKELGEGSSIRQIRTWDSSCVLEITTRQSMQYFKALPESGVVEHAVTRFLAETFPGSVPPVIAFDTDRRWLLLGACAGRSLEMVDDIHVWARAARHYGELQVACMSRIDDLQRAGCPRRDIESLPHVAERCAALRACGIPDSLEHGDLWPANIFVDRNDSVIIDWEDVAIAHPFLSIAPLIVGLDDAGLASKANVEYLKREYLRAFESIAPAEELRRALSLAGPLSFLDLTVRYAGQRSSVVRLHPWMRDLVPQTLQLADAAFRENPKPFSDLTATTTILFPWEYPNPFEGLTNRRREQ
jgi:hypothetical protein